MSRIFFLLLLFLFVLSTFYGQAWIETDKIVPDDNLSFDYFGHAIDMNDQFLMISAIGDDYSAQNTPFANVGSVYVYEKNSDDEWSFKQALLPDTILYEEKFGHDISMYGNYVLISAIGHNPDSNNAYETSSAGAVFVFKLNSITNEWEQFQKLTPSNPRFYGQFGWAVDAYDDYAMISAVSNEDYTYHGWGSLYFFEKTEEGQWSEKQELYSLDWDTVDYFGYDVALYGQYAIASSERDPKDVNGTFTPDRTGSVYSFKKNPATGSWEQKEKIIADGLEAFDEFGHSIDLYEETMVVGATKEDEDVNEENTLSSAGAVYIYDRNSAGIYSLSQKIVASDRAIGDDFGTSVSVHSNYIAVGAPDKDIILENQLDIENAGATYVFKKNNTIWQQMQKLTSSDAISDDESGLEVKVFSNNIGYNAYKPFSGNIYGGAAYLYTLDENAQSSINQVMHQDLIHFYPNPVQNQLMIHFQTDPKSIGICIKNIMGEIVFEHRSIQQKEIAIDFPFPSGTYFIDVSTEKVRQEFSIIKL